MSDEDSPDMPGLLYEAEIPEGLKRPVLSGRKTDEGGGGGGDGNNQRNGDDDEDGDDSRSDGSVTPPSSMTAEGYRRPTVTDVGGRRDGTSSSSDAMTTTGASSPIGDVEMSSAIAGGNRGSAGGSYPDDVDGEMGQADVTAGTTNNTTEIDVDRQRSESSRSASSSSSLARVTVTAKIPFGVAKLYRLPLTSAPPFGTATSAGGGRRGGRGRLRRRPVPLGHISTSPLLQSEGVAASEDDDSSSSPESQDGNGDAPFVIPDHEYTAGES
jgi:hypothetical protein